MYTSIGHSAVRSVLRHLQIFDVKSASQKFKLLLTMQTCMLEKFNFMCTFFSEQSYLSKRFFKTENEKKCINRLEKSFLKIVLVNTFGQSKNVA